MSYNGSGTFVINSTGQPVVTGTVISSSVFNALTADLGTGLSTAITKDGQTTTTARVPFAFGVNSSLTTDATSATTGSIITAGGISMQKALWVGTTSRHQGAAQFDAAITYGGVTLSNAVTGTGKMVLDTSPTIADPTLSGTTTIAAGSAALPAIVSTTGTADTGFWFPAGDTIAASTSGSERMRINPGGSVGIGNPSGTAAILCTNVGSATGIYSIECQVDGTAYFQVRNNGTTYTQGGTVSTISKRETKRDIEPSPYAFEDILGLQLRRFEYNLPLLSGVKKLGLIVDEVENIIPEAIARDADGTPDGLTYTDIALTVAITTMHKLNETLGAVAALAARITALETQ